MASGEVLSFATTDDSHAVGDVPPNQTQPQDYSGGGSQYHYFGPDFMCEIYLDTTIGCFGFNTHGVVSHVPTVSGFSNIDGGETYACAFNEIYQSNYCWGSITRSPTTAEPTAVPTIAPTPTYDPYFSCELDIPDTFTLPLTVTGYWDERCPLGYTPDGLPSGDRFYRYVEFEVIAAYGDWAATLESSEDTYMLLWVLIDGVWYIVDENDDMAQGNTNSRITWAPVEGEWYLLELTTYDTDTLGDFRLTIEDSNASGQGGPSSGQSIEPSSIPFEGRQ